MYYTEEFVMQVEEFIMSGICNRPSFPTSPDVTKRDDIYFNNFIQLTHQDIYISVPNHKYNLRNNITKTYKTLSMLVEDANEMLHLSGSELFSTEELSEIEISLRLAAQHLAGCVNTKDECMSLVVLAMNTDIPVHLLYYPKYPIRTFGLYEY